MSDRRHSARGSTEGGRLRFVAVALGGGAALFAVVYALESFWAPPLLHALLQPVYRVAFFLLLPARVLAWELFPGTFHYQPLRALAFASLITPPAFAALLWAVRRVNRALDAGASETVGDGASDPGRRQFLARSLTGIAGASVCGMSGYGIWIEPERLRVERYTVPIEDLPADLDGLRIVHISDTHHGPFIPLSYLRRAIAAANALEPDLALLTGDYVHKTVEAIAPGASIFAELRARFGVVGVLGNHDYWQSERLSRVELARNGVMVLENQARYLTPEGLVDRCAPGRSLCIGGEGDLGEGRVAFDKTLFGVPPDTPRISLSHNPDAAEMAPAGLRIDLMLSGHTHGGQVSLPALGAPFTPSRYGARYAGGLCAGPRCPVIVSRGVGMSILPVRFGVPPEIGLITLRRA